MAQAQRQPDRDKQAAKPPTLVIGPRKLAALKQGGLVEGARAKPPPLPEDAWADTIVDGREVLAARKRRESKRYTFDPGAVIGEGGCGKVYRGTGEDGSPVAVKTLLDLYATDRRIADRFRSEVDITLELEHPNIVRAIDGSTEGNPFLVMEELVGEDLAERLKRRGALKLGEALDIVLPLCDALQAAHEKGIVHRDVKPANIFLARVGDSDFVKLFDFGVAACESVVTESEGVVVGQTEEGISSRMATERSGALIGTLAYMAPEQANGETADHRMDIFAVGIVIYETLTGRRPFKGDRAFEILDRIRNEDPVPVSQTRDDVPRTVDEIVSRALAKKPEERFQSMAELREALEAVRSNGTQEGGTATQPVVARDPETESQDEPKTRQIARVVSEEPPQPNVWQRARQRIRQFFVG